jgi:phosphoglycerate kinase
VGQLLQLARELDVELVLPSDVRVGRARRAVTLDRLTARSRPVDVGPATLEALRSLLQDAETAFWCGTTVIGDDLGGSRGGDKALARALGSAPGFSVVAGLDTADRVGGLRRLGAVSHVVSGCEAALAFIAGERLPGLDVMED